MRRPLLLAALLAPALATAQTPTSGQILFTEPPNDFVHGRWISLAECQNPNATVLLSWLTKITSGQSFPAGAKYQVYAANKQIENDTCWTQNNTSTNLYAAPVGAVITGENQSVSQKSFKIADFLSVSNITCASVSGDTDVFICVQAIVTDTTGTTTKVGVATGTMTVSITIPNAPPSCSAGPADDGALEISWVAPSGDPIAKDYVITAKGTVAPDTTLHTKADITSTPYTMSGLTNGVPYDISVFARSEAGNPSATAATCSGTPVPVANFWDLYHDPPPDGFGGREQGGCSSGGAGPVALLGVAALLAAIRRRR